MSILLSCDNLSLQFAGRDLFTSLKFGLFEGDRVGLVGPNGAGKSSLLKLLSRQPELLQAGGSGDVIYKKGLHLEYLPQDPVFGLGETIMDRLQKIQEALLPDKRNSIWRYLGEFGLDQFRSEQEIVKLSGGWQKKMALMEVFAKSPDLLLLDEPTNHLDIISIEHLENMLRKSKMSYLLVTHDRAFLQNTTDLIFDLDPRAKQNLKIFNCDYLSYLEQKQQEQQERQSSFEKLKNLSSRENTWLKRGAKARQTKQSARIEKAQQLSAELKAETKILRGEKLELNFGAEVTGPKKLIEATNLGVKRDGKWLVKNLDFSVRLKTRLAIIGGNGLGKTTLIRALIGQIPLDEGRVVIADGLEINYLEQSREDIKDNANLMQFICPDGDYVFFQDRFVHKNSYLERFLFRPEQFEQPISRLSGGEKNRLLLAKIMLKKSQLLILDEPTNDLDIETTEILTRALKEFQGAVLVVTHDRFFAAEFADEIMAFTGDEKEPLILFADLNQMQNWLKERGSFKAYSAKSQGAESSKGVLASSGSASGKSQLSNKEKYELEKMEILILEAEAEQAKIKHKLEGVKGGLSPLETAELYEKLGLQQEKISALYERWAYLEEKSKVR